MKYPAKITIGLIIFAIGLVLVFITACEKKDIDNKNFIFNQTSLKLRPVFNDNRFQQPIGIVQAPGQNGARFVIERAGRIYNVSESSKKLIADLTDRVDATFTESGLLSMAFHPDFENNHYVYLSYTATDKPLISRLSRFTLSNDNESIDKKSEQNILSVPNLYDKHNITQISFGLDGYLYVGFGDGYEGDGDPLKNGQNTNSLMAAILRVDVNKELPYISPPDNPFVEGVGGTSEIYAWGFRNPWRWSFDRTTGDLWVADVGEYHWEEVNIVKKGGNYGWPLREGNHCYGSRWECIKKWFCLQDCPPQDLIDPVAEYSHSEGCAVIGGYVYRGKAIPQLDGIYLFSDACTGTIWGLFKDGDGYQRKMLYTVDEHKRSEGYLTVSFAEDNDGEIYITYYNGTIYQVVPGPDK